MVDQCTTETGNKPGVGLMPLLVEGRAELPVAEAKV